MSWYNPITWFDNEVSDYTANLAEEQLYQIKRIRQRIADKDYGIGSEAQWVQLLKDTEAQYIKNYGPIPETYEQAHAQGSATGDRLLDESAKEVAAKNLKVISDAASNVGEGFENLAWLSKYLIPIGVIIVAVIFALPHLAPAARAAKSLKKA